MYYIYEMQVDLLHLCLVIKPMNLKVRLLMSNVDTASAEFYWVCSN